MNPRPRKPKLDNEGITKIVVHNFLGQNTIFLKSELSCLQEYSSGQTLGWTCSIFVQNSK